MCLADGRRMVIEDVELASTSLEQLEASREMGFRAIQSTLLRDEAGTILGLLTTYFTRPRQFSDDDRLAMDRHARFVAGALARLETGRLRPLPDGAVVGA